MIMISEKEIKTIELTTEELCGVTGGDDDFTLINPSNIELPNDELKGWKGDGHGGLMMNIHEDPNGIKAFVQSVKDYALGLLYMLGGGGA